MTPSVKEPMPGWIDNLNGPFGIYVACFVGLCRTMHMPLNLKLDLIPVDVTVKGLFVAAYKKANEPNKHEVEVYNSTQCDINALTMNQFIETAKVMIKPLPCGSMIWLPGGSVTENCVWHYLRVGI